MRLHLILGDQLDIQAAALTQLDRDTDILLMAEVVEEAEEVANHRQRLVLFLSSMRHFAGELEESGFTVRYVKLDDDGNSQSLGGELSRAVDVLEAETVSVAHPGDHRVATHLRQALPTIEFVPADSVTCSLEFCEDWARGR